RGPNNVTPAILNGNGRSDLVVTNQGSSYVTVFMNTPTTQVSGLATTDILSATIETVQFNVASEALAEKSGAFSITVKLSQPLAANMTIPFTVAGTAVSGVNYAGLTSSPLVIPAGQTSGVIAGTLLDDHQFLAVNNTIVFTLGNSAQTIAVNTLTVL